MGSIEGSTPLTLPTVDISPYLSPLSTPKDQQAVVDAMSHACSTYGFFQLVGHGVSEADRESALDCAKRFFELTPEERMEVWIGKAVGRSLRGYEPPGIQTHQDGLKPDTKEALIIGAEVPADDPESGTFSTGPNLWPKQIPDEELRTPIMEYQAKMVELVKILLKILARGLPKEWNQPADCLDPLAENRPSIPMRLLHYAPQSVEDAFQFGVGDHTDFGCVTILLQELGSKGLEVWYPPTQGWIPVPPKEGAYVINMGDMMQKVTNGFYRSARHRVVSYGASHRYSVPFFLNGQLKYKAKALDGSGVETEVGEHIRNRLINTMGASGKKLQ